MTGLSLRISQPARQQPAGLIALVRSAHQLVATWCWFSGDNNSTVLAHRCGEPYGGLALVDTGFPGPGAQGRANNRLEEGQVMALLRKSKPISDGQSTADFPGSPSIALRRAPHLDSARRWRRPVWAFAAMITHARLRVRLSIRMRCRLRLRLRFQPTSPASRLFACTHWCSEGGTHGDIYMSAGRPASLTADLLRLALRLRSGEPPLPSTSAHRVVASRRRLCARSALGLPRRFASGLPAVVGCNCPVTPSLSCRLAGKSGNRLCAARRRRASL